MQAVSAKRENALRFLRAVLPEKGIYGGAFAPRDKRGRWFRKYFYNVDQLWDALSSWDGDCYFSTCSFREGGSISADSSNMLWNQAFRMDVDYGPGKPIEDMRTALKHVLLWAKNVARVPAPAIVHTGHGLHCYWLLDRPLALVEWERLAEGIEASTENAIPMTRADRAIIGDPVRILRCPGTFNRKDPNDPIKVALDKTFWQFAVRHDPAAFEHLARSAVIELPVSNAAPAEVLNNAGTRAYYTSMLAALGDEVDDRGTWLKVGMALHSLGWGEDAYNIWEDWSRRSDKFDGEDQAKTWASFEREYGGEKVGAGTLVHLARAKGWKPDPTIVPLVFPNQGTPEPVAGQHGGGLGFVCNQHGYPKERNLKNAQVAVKALGIEVFTDVMTYKKWVKMPWLSEEFVPAGEDDDIVITMKILNGYGFDPGKHQVSDVLRLLYADKENRRNLVREYIDGLEWDGTPRLAKWLHNYCGAEDTKFNAAVGLLTLAAAVRRAKKPGCKFDNMLILEGSQGTGKSELMNVLAGGKPGEEWSDYAAAPKMEFHRPQRMMEALGGRWFVEWAELQDVRKHDVDAIKSMLSTGTDKGRPAYGREVVSRGRTCVIIGTCNVNESTGEARYLKDETGNRRFWPVRTDKIDIHRIYEDRDQLFAEAAHYEAKGLVLDLPESLRKERDAAHELRRERTEEIYEERIASLISRGRLAGALAGGEERLTSDAIREALEIPLLQATTPVRQGIARSMRNLGWENYIFKIQGISVRGFRRKASQ